MIKKRIFGMTAMIAAVALVGAGCSDDEDSNPITSTPASNVQVIHASPDAPAVDIYVDGAKAVTSLSFPEGTGYVPLEAGTRNIKVNASGTDVTVINADLTLSPNGTYSVFAVDELNEITALVIEDDLSAPAAGKAHVRFVHLSPDAPAVDIGVTGGGVVFGNKAFAEYTAFTPLDAGTYNLEVRLAGTDTVVLPLPGITLENGKIYTVFAKGFVAGSGNAALGAQIIVNN